MKSRKLLFISIVLIIYSCSNKHKLQKNIEVFLNENVKIFNDYQPISTKVIDTLRQFQLDELLNRENNNNHKADTVNNAANYLSKQGYAYKVYSTLQQIGLQNTTYKLFLDSVLISDSFIRRKYILLKVFVPNLKSERVFMDSIKNSIPMLKKPVGFIVEHKYRIRINGNNTLFVKDFYVDEDYNVLGFAVN